MIATYAVGVCRRPPESGIRMIAGPSVMTIGAVATLIGSFRRWFAAGRVGRSSYELLGLVHRLGFAPSGPVRLLVRLWPLMPLLVTAGVCAVWWGWRSAGAAVGLLGGVYAGVVGAVVALATPAAARVGLSNAPAMTAIGAILVVAGALLTVILPMLPGAARPIKPRCRAVRTPNAPPRDGRS